MSKLKLYRTLECRNFFTKFKSKNAGFFLSQFFSTFVIPVLFCHKCSCALITTSWLSPVFEFGPGWIKDPKSFLKIFKNLLNLNRIRRRTSTLNFASLGIKSPDFSRTEMRVLSSLIDYRVNKLQRGYFSCFKRSLEKQRC